MGKHHASFDEAFLAAEGREQREAAVNQFFGPIHQATLEQGEREARERADRAMLLERERDRKANLVEDGRVWARDRKRNGPLDTRMGAPVDPADAIIIALVEALDEAEEERCYCDCRYDYYD